MPEEKPRSTSATLLARLRDANDHAAWNAFHDRYAPRIRSWCLAKSLSKEDTDDLSQNVLVRVVKLIRGNWVYDPGQNFSGLLRTLWSRAFCDWLVERKRRLDIGAGAGLGTEMLENLQANDFLDWHRDFFRQEALDEAIARLEIERKDDADLVRARLKGESVSQIAERLQEKRATVAMQVSRAIARLRKILAELGSDLSVNEDQA